mgnify:FL=1
MFNDDRSFIENKYHKTDEPFNPYSRMAYHGYDFDKSTGLEDEEIKDGLSKLYEKTKDLPHPVAKAYAVKYVLENTKIDINEHDLFVGLWSVNRLANSVTLNKWDAEVFETILPKVKQKMNDMNESGAVAIWPDFDHVVPDWDAILCLGFSGLKKRAEEYKELHKARGTLTPETAAFFDGIIIEYTAVIALVDRLYRLALTQNHDKAKKVAECLLHIRDGAPQNIYEAMQVIYIYFMVSECFDSYQVRSLGNGLDNTLYSFYKNDLKSGTYTKEEIKELFRYFFFQWSAIGNYWGQPFYMGGTNADGSTKYNELSYDILDVYDELGIYNPKIQVKINENTPDRLLFKVFDMIRRGKSCFALCCEPGMIKAVMGYGATYEEALNMDIRGCHETGVRANEVSTGTGYVNALKSVEYVFSNGFDSRIGKQLGLKTGELKDLKTFEDFCSAVLKQWENLIEMTIDVSKQYEKYLSFINPSNMYSATIEGALKKGADAYQSGVKFNNSALLNCGFASLVDAVMAVKEFVYDKKDVTLEALSAALAADWNGYEDLHTKAVKSPHKYGNDDAETDRYTEAMSAYFASKVNNRPNARGGVYKAIMHTAMEFVWAGKKTGATPDGRYAGDEISKNGSPSVGMDREGVTALIKSALKARPYTYCESFCLDIMLHTTAVSGDEGLEIMKSLLFMYMKNGGQSIQFNVFNTETLRDAQKHPEKYENLQVRVCGWNVLWNNLSEKEQNAYITRAENIK